jgi:hypothetical protein
MSSARWTRSSVPCWTTNPALARRIKRPSSKLSVLAPCFVVIALLGGLTLIAIGLLAPGPAQTAAAVIGFELVVGSCRARSF